MLCEYDGSQTQLYNLSLDRAETLNLAIKHPDQVNNLAKSLLEWNKSMPADNGPALGKEHKVQAKEKNSKN